jgi:hypothetical protein
VAVSDDIHDVAEPTQHRADHRLVHRVVLDQQQLHRRHLGRCRRGFGFRRGRAYRQREPDPGALARRAVDADLAAHQADKAAADREAEAGAAVQAPRRGAGLAIRLEQRAEPVGRDAGARVGHGEAQAGRLRPYRQRDVAGGRELDGVGQQVAQHLAQPAGVADQRLRHARFDLEAQLDALGGRRRPPGRRDLVEQRTQHEGHVLQLPAAGFDPRQVQQVGEQPQHRLARGDDALGQPRLLRRQRRLGQQLGGTENAGHRRAQLVADGRQESQRVAVQRPRRGGGILQFPGHAHSTSVEIHRVRPVSIPRSG